MKSTYVPILKYKSGEMWALTNLRPTNRPLIRPLIEMHSDDTDGSEIIDDLVNCMPGGTVYVDTASDNVLLTMLDEAASQNYSALPVTRILRKPVFQSILSSHPHVTQHGLMLRLYPSDFSLQANIRLLISQLLSALGKRESDIDLLLDLGQITSAGAATALFLGLVAQMPSLANWRSFYVASSGFPSSSAVQMMPAGSWHFTPRHDWQSWVNLSTHKLPRLPSFSDYTVREPDFPPGFAPRYVTVRYTTDKTFMIRRELKSSTPPPYSPAIAICADLVSRPEYCGPNFSQGDLQIQQRAANPASPGSPLLWIREAINHHMEFVIQAIASLP